jgi:predicted transcriptional regulator
MMEAAYSMRVSELVPSEQKIVSVPHDSWVREAIDLMHLHAFSQLPVEADDGSVVGLFSYKSLARNLGKFNASEDILSKRAGDLVDEPYFVRPTESLSTIIDRLNIDGAILIGSEQDVLAVATVHDLSDFLWSTAQPLILIGEIETMLRQIMATACPLANLSEVISRSFTEGTKSACALEELPLGDLITVLKNGTNFGRYFKSWLGDMNYMSLTLDPVPPIRNRMFHFRGKPSEDDLELLDVARIWLNRRWKYKQVAVQK